MKSTFEIIRKKNFSTTFFLSSLSTNENYFTTFFLFHEIRFESKNELIRISVTLLFCRTAIKFRFRFELWQFFLRSWFKNLFLVWCEVVEMSDRLLLLLQLVLFLLRSRWQLKSHVGRGKEGGGVCRNSQRSVGKWDSGEQWKDGNWTFQVRFLELQNNFGSEKLDFFCNFNYLFRITKQLLATLEFPDWMRHREKVTSRRIESF